MAVSAAVRGSAVGNELLSHRPACHPHKSTADTPAQKTQVVCDGEEGLVPGPRATRTCDKIGRQIRQLGQQGSSHLTADQNTLGITCARAGPVKACIRTAAGTGGGVWEVMSDQPPTST